MLVKAFADACCRAHTGVQHALSARQHWFLATCAGFAVVLLFFYGIVGAGLPELRHDWSIPGDRISAFRTAAQAFAGWQFVGIGEPNVYPLNYVAGVILAPVTYIVGGIGELILILAVTTIVAFRCAHALGAKNIPESVAAAAVLLLNPWSYNQYVAGHLYMPLACYSLFCLWGELRSKPFHRGIALLYFLGCMQQMQFLLPAIVLSVAYGRRNKDFPLYALGAAALVSPIVFGILTHLRELQSIPNLLAWETTQSVSWLSGIQLTGYGPHYASRYELLWIPNVLLLSLGLLVALVYGGQNRLKALAAAISALIVAFLVNGTIGPLGFAISWVFQHGHAIAVYRELYDLVGLICVAWVYVLLVAWRSAKGAAICCIGLGIIFGYSWLAHPAFDFFVSSGKLPGISALSNSTEWRIALMPPFQPLSFDGMGSGLDPDAIGRASVVNSPFPTYPISGALSGAWINGRYQTLAALGVKTIIRRSKFHSLIASQQFVTTSQRPHMPTEARSTDVVTLRHPAPVVGIIDHAAEETIPGSFGANSFSASETCEVQEALIGTCHSYKFMPVLPFDAVTNPEKGWVSVGTLSYLQPQFANLPRGYYTRSRAEMPIPSARSLLVDVSGTAIDQRGTSLTGDTHGLQWIHISNETRAFVCQGSCTILDYSPDLVPNLIAKRAGNVAEAKSYRRPFDWLLVVANVNSGQTRVLRLAETYDRYWAAFSSRHELTHFEIDNAINGWVVPPHSDNVYVVNLAAAAVEILELVGCFSLALVVASSLVSRRRAKTN